MYARLDQEFSDRSPPSDRIKLRKNIKRYPAGDPLPRDPIGQKLTELFPNGWDWIYAEIPEDQSHPEWETVKHYPLTPQQLWEYFQDPDCLVGTRPKSETRWIAIDIDKNSPHHPYQASEALDRIRGALESIGICRIQVNQSSYSGGLHLYCPLSEAVSSFWLSIAVKYALETIDITLKSGQCEIFPNPKRYKPRGKGFSNYAAIRLPMQPESGFHPLDDDLNPLPWTLENWLEQFERLSEQQDQSLLSQAIADAKVTFKQRKKREPRSVQNWQESIATEKAEGWTGAGQTNEKLKTFACEARVFLALDTIDDIADHIHDTALNSPGFYEFSNHVRDIRRRSLEVAAWAYEYYWPYGSDPQRSTTYRGESKVADFQYHKQLKEKSQEKIKAAVIRLRAAGQLLPGISDRANQLIFEAKVSRKTLYKTHNLEFWHPKCDCGAAPDENASKSPESQSESECLPYQPKLTQNDKLNPLKPLENKESFQSTNYEGFVDPQNSELSPVALPPQGQRAAKGALESSNVVVERPEITNWEELKASLPLSLQAKITKKQQKYAEKEDISENDHKTPAHSQTQESFEIKQREPLPHEVEEFETWYALSREFGIARDFEWQFTEYFVESHGKWIPYSEISASFTVSKLRQYLGY